MTPVINGQGQFAADLAEVLQPDQGYDTLGHAVNIQGKRLIVKIFGRPVLPEKMVHIKFETLFDMGIKFPCPGIVADILQGAEVVTRVKVVHPGLGSGLPVIPGAVFPLPARRVARRLEGRFQNFFSPVRLYTRQSRAAPRKLALWTMLSNFGRG